MTFTSQYKDSLLAALATVDLTKVDQAIAMFKQARDDGRHVFVCGNGGSSSTASHFTCDIVKCASYERAKRFRMISLSDCTPTMTAYSNDVGYDSVFVEQLRNFAQAGDVVMGISGLGNSPNVLRAIEYANSIGCKTIGLTGRDGGKLGKMVQLEVRVADPHMGRIEDAHLVITHMICYYFIDQPGV